MKKWKTQYDRDSGKGTKFEKAYFIRKGQKEDVQEFINSQNEDVEIYPTMEKYNGLLPNSAVEKKPIEVDGKKRAKDEILNPVENKKAAKIIVDKYINKIQIEQKKVKKAKKITEKKEEKPNAENSVQ